MQEVGAGGFELTTSESDAELPVSVVPINRLPVVLLYVPLVEDVTLILIVHVLLPATVMFENESDWGGPLTVNVDGDGEPPHPL